MPGRVWPARRFLPGRPPRPKGRADVVDALTGLPTREALLRSGSARLRHDRALTAVLVVDVDGMKEVNDAFGHEVGDRVLVACATRLVAALGRGATVARVGGDEFAAVVTVADDEAAGRLARRVGLALAQPVVAHGLDLPTTSSVGLAVAGRDGDDLPRLLAAADQRMYAGRAGAAPQPPRLLRGGPSPDAADLLADLVRAVRAGSPQLRLHYQPQVAAPGAPGGEVVGFAACARWEHPRLGPLPAAAFVPLAERSGLAAALDDVLLATALTDWPVLRSRLPRAHLTVTLSAHTLFAPGLAQQLSGHLARAAVDGRCLRLGVAPFATRLAPRSRAALSRLGVGLSVQGFGAARSSVTALARQPLVQEVRLDAPLVADLRESAEARRLVRGLVDGAHGLGLTVLAAQLESAVVADHLTAVGCDTLQGYWVAPPLALLDVTEWLDFWERTTPAQVVRSGLQD